MKKLLLLAALLLSMTSRAQEDSISSQEDFIPDDKVLVNESIEETKQKMLESRKRIDSYKDYVDWVNDYKTSFEAFDYSKIDQCLANIKNFLKTDKAKVFSEEERLLNLLYGLYITYGLNVEDKVVLKRYTAFFKKVNDLVSGVNTVFDKIRDAHSMDIYFKEEAAIDSFSQLLEVPLKDAKQKIGGVIKDEIDFVNTAIKDEEKEYRKMESFKQKLYAKMNERETQINGLAIKLGLPLFCGTILLLFLGPTLIRLLRKGQTEAVASTNSQNVLLEISTVLLLTMTILILGLSGKINGDVLGTLIGGISGYVLNKMRTGNNNTSSNT